MASRRELDEIGMARLARHHDEPRMLDTAPRFVVGGYCDGGDNGMLALCFEYPAPDHIFPTARARDDLIALQENVRCARDFPGTRVTMYLHGRLVMPARRHHWAPWRASLEAFAIGFASGALLYLVYLLLAR